MNQWFAFKNILYFKKKYTKITIRYYLGTFVDYSALNTSNNKLYGIAHNYSYYLKINKWSIYNFNKN